MGLEDLVNLLLKPIEGVAQLVYDVCFATKIERVVTNGKVSYNTTYSNNSLRPYFDRVKNAYGSVKKFVQEKVVRRLDSCALYLEKYVNESIVKPVSEFYNKNKLFSWGLIGLGAYLII